MGIAFLLIALGYGFKVYAEASANTRKRTKQLGRAIGIFIMVVSLLGSVCSLTCLVKGKDGYGRMCPLTSKFMGSELTS